MQDRKMLVICLNDHLAGTIAVEKVARRCADSNSGSALGERLKRSIPEWTDEIVALRAFMRAMRIRESHVKKGAAVAAERLGRLKLNGRITQYSDLSRVYELEGLLLWTHAMRNLWLALGEHLAPHPDLDSTRPAELALRAAGRAELLNDELLAALAKVAKGHRGED